MVVKSKVKLKVIKARSKTTGKSRAVVKAKVANKRMSKPDVKAKPTRKIMKKTSAIKAKSVTMSTAKPAVIGEVPVAVKIKPAAVAKIATPVLKRVINPLAPRRPIKRSQRANQFTYMKAPGLEHAFEVADTVEVFCDHEKNRERIRGWVKGIVVQVDHKMVAVQFRSNVYLTDGWMVPDRILWYPVNSEHIRAVAGKKIVKKDFIPDY